MFSLLMTFVELAVNTGLLSLDTIDDCAGLGRFTDIKRSRSPVIALSGMYCTRTT